ncbi:hypothetical protein SDC9_207615 [bioreactor metagenome]|uniref:Uncharacterized protein n=1 Tax=bioreactor metagenome TaxID=1076179 RepID=A0A645JJU0_9ZZZZ
MIGDGLRPGWILPESRIDDLKNFIDEFLGFDRQAFSVVVAFNAEQIVCLQCQCGLAPITL